MPQRLSDVPLSELVPETREWNGGHGIDLLAWFGCVASIEHAIACGELFWPDFVGHDGCVLFAGFSEESYRGFLAQAGGNRRAVEGVMNHRHISDILLGPERQTSRHQVLYLWRPLREMRAAKLHQDFPAKDFVVSFPEEPSEWHLGYQITFCQTGV